MQTNVSAVSPLFFFAFTSAPAAIRPLTQSASPLEAASVTPFRHNRSSIYVRAGGDKGLDAIRVALGYSEQERCITFVVLRIHVRAGGDKSLDAISIAILAANVSAVSRLLFFAFTSAPAAIRALTQSASPPLAANVSADSPFDDKLFVFLFASAPAAIRTLTQSALPLSAANVSAVSPKSFFEFTSAPQR